jgi:bilirubin oxidase
LQPAQLQIPFIPETACGGASDISPIWNPEFFGNTMLVNGRAWPYLEVERRRYRFRILNGCNSRFLILKFSSHVPMWQIGAEGGFLPAPVEMTQLLMAPAERADVIVDFSDVPADASINLLNLGPDEPFGGHAPAPDFDAADPDTTGQVMQFRVVPRVGNDPSTNPSQLSLPARAPLGPAEITRRVSLNEEDSMTVYTAGANGVVKLACDGSPFGPRAALLGTVQSGNGSPRMWDDPITENIRWNTTEIWEIHNFTADAHPIHIHQVMFEVLNRQVLLTGGAREPEPWERGSKDTVVAFPGEIRHRRTVRMALSYRRARGQRDDAPVSSGLIDVPPTPQKLILSYR